jgi:small-conductance mechanosensitive channel
MSVADEMWHRFAVEAGLFLPRLVTATLMLVGLWVAGVLGSRFVARVLLAREVEPDLAALLTRAGRLTLVSVGFVTALGTIGVDVKALVAGLGLTGFALGFALRDIIANTLAGILILAYKPFRRGDRITVAGCEGIIAEIDLRYTVLTGDRETHILIPNSTLFTNSIVVAPRAAANPDLPRGGGTTSHQ